MIDMTLALVAAVVVVANFLGRGTTTTSESSSSSNSRPGTTRVGPPVERRPLKGFVVGLERAAEVTTVSRFRLLSLLLLLLVFILLLLFLPLFSLSPLLLSQLLLLLLLSISLFSFSSILPTRPPVLPLSFLSRFIVGLLKPSSEENLGDVRPPERRLAPVDVIPAGRSLEYDVDVAKFLLLL